MRMLKRLSKNKTMQIGAPRTRRYFSSYIIGVFCLGVVVGIVFWQGLGMYVNAKTKLAPVYSNNSLPSDLDYTSVEEVYDALRNNYDGELELEDILNGLKNGLAKATEDPYTTFFTEEENNEFNGEVNGTFSGIGAELLSEDNVIIVATPLSGYPAEKAGLRARDIILKINGTDATSLSVVEAVKLIRGEVGTTVKLTVLRGDEQLEYSIVRATITIPSLTFKIENNIGYMQISRFSTDTYQLASEAAKYFVDNKVKGVIVDLRNNPGGYLDQAIAVSSLWVEKGEVVVVEKRGDITEKVERSLGGNILDGYKTVVLINGGSASASEIVAGALRDNDKAILLGEKTFGKGSVQQIEEFIGGSALKVTIAKWYTPEGKNIDKEGIVPDKEVLVTTEQIEKGIDSQKDTAMLLF